jgi:iodotyrosine deiodinase
MQDYEPIPLPDRDSYSTEEMKQRAQDYYQFIKRRHSVRHFSDKPVPREIIETCIRAAGTAPSGANHQPWHFVCIGDASVKRKIRIAAEHEEAEFYGGKAGDTWLEDLDKLGTDAQKPFLETAPWLIAIFLERSGVDDEGNKRKNYYMPESVGIATGFLLNALHSAGLATLTHTPAPMKFLSEILERPDTERPYMLVVVGHAAAEATVPAAALVKKSLGEISTFLD